MEVNLTWDEYVALLKGQYALLPCIECENGVVYWNGETGDVVSEARYRQLCEEEDIHEQCQELCEYCMGMGKVVRFD